MLDANIRKWCQDHHGPTWYEDPRTKWTFVLSAHRALGMDVPAKVRRAAARARDAGAGALHGQRPRKRRRAPSVPAAAARPASHFCPISHEIMLDPVVCPDGHSYEKEQLATWLRVKRISPMTQQPIPEDAAFPRNHALRHAIEAFGAGT